MKVHFIHGIRTDANSPVKGLIPYLHDAGFDVRYPDYGFELAVETRVFNPMLVGALLPYIEDGDVAIGHSNGCAIIYELLARYAPLRGVVFINGALEQDFTLPKWVSFAHVYWNPGDEITEAAKLGAELGVVDTDWGPLGHGGYLGDDPRVTRNPNCSATAGLPLVSGHSDIFTPVKLSYWAPQLIGDLKTELGL
jgi:pimeloyl-ACP methyl ester carboxylesterase